MKQETPSYSAEVVASYRAVESLKPEHGRVCYDPLAVHFLRPSFRLLFKLGPLLHPLFWLLAERNFSCDVAQGIGRTRYIDDYVDTCLGNGIRQLVILGAGYDSRAYRIEGLEQNVKVFEVDHPSTQNAKKKKLVGLFGSLPSHVAYVSVDFDRESFAEKLFANGYDGTLKTLFIWEGVTYFLTRETVDDTLTFVRNKSGNGSTIIFDYTFTSVVDGTYDSAEAKREKEVLARLGEPLSFGIEEGKIREFLTERGFCEITEVSPEFLTNAYFKAAKQNRQFPPFFPLVHAAVSLP
ncbi:MAG: SAM-dependent methyltransferase [Gammaproteobacteria bacterium]